jgi:hypothetical protein
MLLRLLLRGLNEEQSFAAFSLMLFSPFLRERVCVKEYLDCCDTLIDRHFFKKPAKFVAEYERMAKRLNKLLPEMPMPSLANPPFAMISLDLRHGLIPWVTPGFGEFLRILLSADRGFEGAFADELPIAFVLHGGPGDSKETAFRLATPSGKVRAWAEYWLARIYLPRAEQRLHARLTPEADGRTFNMHRYLDQHGAEKYIYFETTRSLGREKEDFLECLQELSGRNWCGCSQSRITPENSKNSWPDGNDPKGNPPPPKNLFSRIDHQCPPGSPEN